MRLVRKLAAVVLVGAPLGSAIALSQASAVVTINPTIVLTSTPPPASPVVAGAENWTGTYTATVTGGGIAGNYPEGLVTFEAVGPTTVTICTDDFTTGPTAPTATSPDTVNYACTSAAQAALVPGSATGLTYNIEAVFTPDAPSSSLTGFANTTQTSDPNGSVIVYTQVAPSSVTTTVNPSATPAANTAISDTANIATTGGPTFGGGATVTFNLYNGLVCGGGVVATETDGVSQTTGNNSSVTSGTLVTPTVVGATYSILATYNGNNFTTALAATCEPFTVGKFADTIGTVATSSALAGQSIQDVVTISGLSTSPAPTGNVNLALYSGTGCTGAIVNTWTDVLTSTSGSQVFTDQYNNTPAGTYSWLASYAGDTNNAASVSPCETGGTGTTVTAPPPPPPPPATLVILTNSLPSGARGRMYAAQIRVTGGTGADHFTTISGQVPPGTALNPSTGWITGILPGHNVYTFEVQVTDSGTPTPQVVTHWYSIFVS